MRQPSWAMRGRLRAFFVLPVLLLFGLFLAPSAGATIGAVGTAAGFEDNDADLAANDTPNFDWNSFASVTWTGTSPYQTAVKTASGWSFKGFEDAEVSATDSGFAGGVKQDDDCGTTKASKAPNKDDLKRIYLGTKIVNGHVYLEIAWVRIPQNSTSASAHVGYEFNQGKVVSGQTLMCGGDPNLTVRKGGDMLIVYDFEGGSGPPAIKMSRWLKTGEFNGGAGATCEVNNSTAAKGCWGDTKVLSATGFAEGLVNQSTVTDGLKPGGSNPGPVEFGEAGIDLTAAGIFTSQTCAAFGNAYAVSRSSGNSQQAAMEDIVGPGAFAISNCANLTINKLTSDNSSTAGFVFNLYSGPKPPSGSPIASCTTNASGGCDVTSGSFTGLAPGTYTIDEVQPSGYTKDPALPEQVTLAAGDNVTKTYTNTRVPGSVEVTKTDDDDPAIAVDGAVFQLYAPAGHNSSGPTGNPVSGKACTTVGGNSCTITNVLPGSYTIDETTVPTGYAKDSSLPKEITVTSGQATAVNVVDPRLFKMIVLVCKEADNSLYSSNVTINNSVRPASLTSAGRANAGLSQADETALCQLTEGAKGGLKSDANNDNTLDTHVANVTIPK